MQFPRKRHNPSEDQRILPLTNIVFLLLIFFMLAGRLSAPDAFSIQPPQSVSQAPAHATGLLIEVNDRGVIAIDGERIEPQDLRPAVQAYLDANTQGEVRLKADGDTNASRIVAVMGVLREVGIERLRLLTTQTAN